MFHQAPICQFPEHEDLGRSRHWKVRVVATVAKVLGVLVHIDGVPYGSGRNVPPNPSAGVVNLSPVAVMSDDRTLVIGLDFALKPSFEIAVSEDARALALEYTLRGGGIGDDAEEIVKLASILLDAHRSGAPWDLIKEAVYVMVPGDLPKGLENARRLGEWRRTGVLPGVGA